MFGIRVLATEEETALITHAARKQGLSASQFVTRVAKRLPRNLKVGKIAYRGATSPKQAKSLRRKPKS